MLRYIVQILFILQALLFEQPVTSSSDFMPTLDVEFSSIDVIVNTSLPLQCSGTKPLKWEFINPLNGSSIPLTAQRMKKIDEKYISTINLTFTSYTDTGRYVCYYENERNSFASLYIFVDDFEHLLLSSFQVVYVHEAKRTRVPCYPTNSKAKVTFWKGIQKLKLVAARDIESFDPTEGFFLKAPTNKSSGPFKCIAKLENRSDSSTTLHLIFVRETQSVPRIFINDNLAKYVLVGSNFSLTCIVKVEAYVNTVITWSPPMSNKDRVIIGNSTLSTNTQKSQFHEQTKRLTVIKAEKSDEGVYQCNATDQSNKSNYFEVNVRIFENEQDPILNFTSPVDPTSTIIRHRGETVELKASFIVFPPSKNYDLTWMKDDIGLANKIGHYQISQDVSEAALNIQNLKADDSGMYTLVGVISGHKTNVSFRLLVKDLPQVHVENSEPCCYLKGKDYTILCIAEGFPVANVTWKWKPYCLNHTECPSTIDWTAVEGDNYTSTYTATDLESTDPLIEAVATLKTKAEESKFYQCQAENEVGTAYQNIDFVITDVPNGFDILYESENPVELDTFSMTCMGNLVLFSNISWSWKPTYEDDNINLDENTVYSMTSYSKLATINISTITRNQSGVYECSSSYRNDSSKSKRKSVSILVQGLEKPYFVDTNMNDAIYTVEPNMMLQFTCYVNGTPRPSLSWFQDDKIFLINTSRGRFEDDMQKLVITRVVPEDSGYFECRAKNRVGVTSQNATLNVILDAGLTAAPSNTMNKNQVITLVIVTIFASLCALSLVVFVGRCVYMKKKKKRTLLLFSHQNFKEGQMAIFNPDMSLGDQAELLPYDERWEFSTDRLKLGRTLGQGAFGRVVKAEAIGINDSESSTTVAVKMLKERTDIDQQKALMAELKILIHLGHHLNIVNLLGAVTKSIQYGELYVIVEYCKYGNLRHFLLRHRDKFVDQWSSSSAKLNAVGLSFQSDNRASFSDSDQSLLSPSAFSIENPSYRQQLISQSPDRSQSQMSTFGKMSDINTNEGFSSSCSTGSSGTVKTYSRTDSKEHTISTGDLICFAFQSARGMEYLASQKLIHRDLAARNVLLAEENVVKICDFGLAKDCYKYSNYVKKGNGPLPIKWMAIESLCDKVYTTKSDVWSFGVLLWEFFTLGGNPYPGIEVDDEFYRRLKIGYRMSKPEFCPDLIYQIMRDCWQTKPKDRPEFTELSNILGSLLESGVRQHYIDLNDPYQEMNEKHPGHIYLNDLQPETSYMNTADFAQDVDGYDKVPQIRSIDDNPVPKEAMEVVPMIRLDSITEEKQTVKKDDQVTNNSGPEQYTPDYLCMGNSPTKTPLLQEDDSVFF